MATSKRKSPAEIVASMEKKKKLSPAVPTNFEGYVSPNYERMSRNLASLSTDQRRQFEDIMRARRAPLEARDVVIPENIQSTGQPQIAKRANDPGALTTTETGKPLPGAIGIETTAWGGKFSKYATPEMGMRALERQVRMDRERGMTLEEFFYKYAPPESNNTELYIEQAARRLGVNRDAGIRSISPSRLAEIIARKESQTRVVPRAQ